MVNHEVLNSNLLISSKILCVCFFIKFNLFEKYRNFQFHDHTKQFETRFCEHGLDGARLV